MSGKKDWMSVIGGGIKGIGFGGKCIRLDDAGGLFGGECVPFKKRQRVFFSSPAGD